MRRTTEAQFGPTASSHGRRRGLFGFACVCVLAAVAGIAAPSTLAAADDCPNAQVRQQQGSQFLPDCRAYELVSKSDANGAQVMNGSGVLSVDGKRVAYGYTGAVPGTTSGSRPRFLATRTQSGWTSTSILPPRSSMVSNTYFPTWTSPDLSRWLASATLGFGQSTTTPDLSLVRLDDTGAQTLLRTFTVPFDPGAVAIGSDNGDRVFAAVPDPIDDSHQPDTHNVYDFGTGAPQLVSRMPGTNEAPACGVDVSGLSGFLAADSATTSTGWVSADGSKVFFATQGDEPGCGDPFRLYRRDLDTGTTTPISGPALPGDTEFDHTFFAQAAKNGSWVVYRTATSLDPADDDDGFSNDADVYRWSEGGGNVCVTCIVPRARVVPGGTGRVAASENGSHVYFTSTIAHADAPPGTPTATNAAPHLYVISNGTIHYISRISGSPGAINAAFWGGYLTPDGNVLIFQSNRVELNAISGSDNGGVFQFYRYDDRDQSVTCVSCPPPGEAVEGVPFRLGITSQYVPAALRAASDDGSMVFFATFDSLLSEDVNQERDLYEWHDGTVSLISNGAMNRTREPVLIGLSVDGHDVLFQDSLKLTWDAKDSATKLYSARIGGGFSEPSSPSPCSGDACFGPPSPPPSALVGGSDAFVGTGNAGNRRVKPRRCANGKRRVRSKGKVRCVKRNRVNGNRRTSR